MFRARASWVRFSERFKLLRTRTRSFSTNTSNNGKANSNKPTRNDTDIVSEKVESNVSHYDERYRQLENMDFMTAAKMLFTDPPKKKKFGLDFHLVQLFFALMPSLAVYLVAQYAHYEMRKMEVEVEQKRKQKEEEEGKEREKEMKLNPPEEKEAMIDPQILKVKERLDKLEEAVEEIVIESKKQSSSKPIHDEKKHLESSVPRSDSRGSISDKAEDKDHLNKHDAPKLKPELVQESLKHSVADASGSPQDQKGQNQGIALSNLALAMDLRENHTSHASIPPFFDASVMEISSASQHWD